MCLLQPSSVSQVTCSHVQRSGQFAVGSFYLSKRIVPPISNELGFGSFKHGLLIREESCKNKEERSTKNEFLSCYLTDRYARNKAKFDSYRVRSFGYRRGTSKSFVDKLSYRVRFQFRGYFDVIIQAFSNEYCTSLFLISSTCMCMSPLKIRLNQQFLQNLKKLGEMCGSRLRAFSPGPE